jgi:acetoin utilization deacetylase AcuC-like enzyme
MVLFDPSFNSAHADYGIMLPISPSRAGRIAEFVAEASAFPGPFFDLKGALRFLCEDTGRPVLLREDLERVHSKEFIAALYEEGPDGEQGLVRELLKAWELIDDQGRPHRYEPEKAVRPLRDLFRHVLAQVGGTYLVCRLALAGEIPAEAPGPGSGSPGFCYYLGGGTHHARYDGGAGFCLVNDIMIAARKIQAEKRAGLVWIIDVDAHKGCGTAELVHFARKRGELGSPRSGETGHSPEILNLSIHMGSGWPLDAETLKTAVPGRAPRINADVEIPIEAGEEARYVPELEKGIRTLETLSADYAVKNGFDGTGPNAKPDLVILVDGADPYEHDGLPSSDLLKLSLEQCLERDFLIYDYLRQRGIPSAWIMAGGYGDRAWEPPAHFLRKLQDRRN